MNNINHLPNSAGDELEGVLAKRVGLLVLLGRALITEVTMAEMSFVVRACTSSA